MASKSSLRGKSALVVGGTAGIGEGIAVALAKSGASVTVCGRNVDAGSAVVGRLREAGPSGEHRFERLDASLLRNVREFTERVKDRPLDYLVLTQGISSFGGRSPTAEGLEIKLALHYYSRMLLVKDLLPVLEKSETPRVLSVLSGGMHKAYLGWDDPDLERNFSLWNAANAAGFYNDLALESFAKEHPKVGFMHAAPGFVRSKWGDTTALAPLLKLMKLFARSADSCGDYMVKALEDPRFATGFHPIDKDGNPAKLTPEHTPENITRVRSHFEDVVRRLTGGTSVKSAAAPSV